MLIFSNLQKLRNTFMGWQLNELIISTYHQFFQERVPNSREKGLKTLEIFHEYQY